MAVQENDVEMTTEDGENTSEKDKTPKIDVEALSLAGNCFFLYFFLLYLYLHMQSLSRSFLLSSVFYVR